MRVKLKMAHRTQGDTPVFADRLDEIIAMFPEFTWGRSREVARWEITESTSSLDLWDELSVRDESGKLLAFAILADDHDAHVGPLMGVQWCMAFPDAPSWAIPYIHRAARKHAKRCGYGVMAYTHRRAEGRYEINYVKV